MVTAASLKLHAREKGEDADIGVGEGEYKDEKKMVYFIFPGKFPQIHEKTEKGLQFPWAILFVAEVI